MLRQFPTPANRDVNMMPIVMGDSATLPLDLHPYLNIINACGFRAGATVYLTVKESLVRPGEFNRRPGIHTDATNAVGWGWRWMVRSSWHLPYIQRRCV